MTHFGYDRMEPNQQDRVALAVALLARIQAAGESLDEDATALVADLLASVEHPGDAVVLVAQSAIGILNGLVDTLDDTFDVVSYLRSIVARVTADGGLSD